MAIPSKPSILVVEQKAARVAGCDAVIAKPYDLAELANTLTRISSKGLAAFDA